MEEKTERKKEMKQDNEKIGYEKKKTLGSYYKGDGSIYTEVG